MQARSQILSSFMFLNDSNSTTQHLLLTEHTSTSLLFPFHFPLFIFGWVTPHDICKHRTNHHLHKEPLHRDVWVFLSCWSFPQDTSHVTGPKLASISLKTPLGAQQEKRKNKMPFLKNSFVIVFKLTFCLLTFLSEGELLNGFNAYRVLSRSLYKLHDIL